MEITKVVKPFIRRGWPNTFGNIVYIVKQGRNHGIDIGGVQMWALPQIFFLKFSRGSDRKNKQARPSTNE